MSASDGVFNNLRQKLDVLGYTQTLPLAGIPLVAALFEDLVKSTESLRDAKKKIVDLLEEKSCWELGVEPYKCDNSRLLAECNQLHQQNLKDREDYEQRNFELGQKIRNLVTDKFHLEEQCQQLQQQLSSLLAKHQSTVTGPNMRNVKDKAKKPFVSTVRSGERIPPLLESGGNIRCTKCTSQTTRPHAADSASVGVDKMPSAALKNEIDRLEDRVKNLLDQLEFYKRKIESRDREIRRLNELLTGGRPPAALAKDCCFKDVRGMSEDIENLQREKTESLNKIREYQEQMHEAMERALSLETHNKQLQQDLDELKVAALAVETQANSEIAQREQELEDLQNELKKLRNRPEKGDNRTQIGRRAGGAGDGVNNSNDSSAVAALNADKRRLNERINELTQRDAELKSENERLLKKLSKLKGKIHGMQKELQDNVQQKEQRTDEEKIRIKSERDFFQKEYLRLISKAGSEKEVEFLQSQIKSKDDELRLLRAELCLRQQERLMPTVNTANAATATATAASLASARSNHSAKSTFSAASSDCVQAVVLRAERERDCARAELERVRCERDTLREKHVSLLQTQSLETQKSQTHIGELNARLRQLERENRELSTARVPHETHIVLLKEEIDELKRQIFALQEENTKLRTRNSQFKILNEQTERTLQEYQSKLAIAERQLQTADTRLNDLDSNREVTHREAAQLRNEVAALKKTYVSLESEKDKILTQLDAKTERAYQLEFELKLCKEKRLALEKEVKELEEKLSQLTAKTRERTAELHETSTESKSLRQQIAALKISRDEAIAENGRLSNELAERQAEILTLKKKLKDSDFEIEQLKQQLRQYVAEVKKAEDLLTHKEKEREEMLEHYRSLSHDAVILEGNNQSLEVEAAEHKRQITELEDEIKALKQEICSRNALIAQIEDKLTALNAQNAKLERELEDALDEQHLLKVDLAARKELCDKLDVERDKLNAELTELNEIKRKLERDNEKLRADLEKSSNGQKVSSETLEELLTKTRRDLEEQIKVDSKLSQELVRQRQQNDDLLRELDAERQRRHQQETLAQEYQIQNQELRHNLTDDRFRQARSRDQSPRYPSQTL
ncbi:centrosomal protein of 135 kDa isoform X1 [Bactrocera neohumeralis]|uniref:centrosomal protein of 135 kDa isoform X1 n=1 Tax=Bactrocera neohumeralis TaxID=98809 RepID=UPI002166793B|nr:centrosomal protein of 135 kDa isoform X1 [Bactrocera neohumeralis]